jgi:DNA-binding LytR/AlgR family response regulator
MKNIFDKDYFLIRENLVTHKLKYNDVFYISALENYIQVHTPKKVYMVLCTMRQFEHTIDQHPFVRVNRSCIVNLNFISTFGKDSITLENEAQITLGELYKKDFENIFVEGKILKR